MAYFQRVQMMGVTGSDPTFKVLETGPFARFSVAVEEWYVNQQGDKKKITTWFRCSAFGRVAEKVVKQLPSGTWVFVEGRMRVRKVENREFFSITVDMFRRLVTPTKHETEEQKMPDYESAPQ